MKDIIHLSKFYKTSTGLANAILKYSDKSKYEIIKIDVFTPGGEYSQNGEFCLDMAVIEK